MKMPGLCLLLALTLCLHVEGQMPPTNLPPSGTVSKIVYECRRVPDDAIRIDGELTDAAWHRAVPMQNFRTAGPNPQPAKRTSRVLLVWSENRLFLGFECRTDVIHSTVLTNRDDDIWYEECAELFLCPRGPEAKYYEIDFNPQNVIYDSMLSSYRYDQQVKHYKEWALQYNARIESRTKILRDESGQVSGWVVEAAIQFADLAQADHVPPRPGDLWLFNTFRIAKVHEKTMEYSAWEPTLADFHRPWMFPQLRFEE